jgi:hypothetical protein
MKINIFKSEANKDHLLLVVEWPHDITKELINFLKQVPSIDMESIVPEKANSVAFKLVASDEEEEKNLKMAIISTIRRLLTDGQQQTDEKVATYLLTKEQMQNLLSEMEKLAQENLTLKGELLLRRVQERYLVVATGCLFLCALISMILTGLSIVWK